MAVRFAIANEDGAVLNLEDTRIRDGDSEDVGGKVLQACLAGAYGLGIDVPVELPGLRGDLIEETGFFYFITELGFKNDGESSDGKIEIEPGGVPEAISGGEGASGDDVMDMGVILESSPPGVQDAEESREISADVMLIRRQKLVPGNGNSVLRLSNP